jgi:hypothetical protein
LSATRTIAKATIQADIKVIYFIWFLLVITIDISDCKGAIPCADIAGDWKKHTTEEDNVKKRKRREKESPALDNDLFSQSTRDDDSTRNFKPVAGTR